MSIRYALLLAGCLFLVTTSTPASAQPGFGDGTVYYVSVAADTSGNGCTSLGDSWACPFLSLQNALAAAESGDELWVADGTYRPDDGDAQTSGDRAAVFEIPSGVGVFGGFDGTEANRSERTADPALSGTVLSGDIGVSGDATDNARVVARFCNADAATRLDGVTVRDAYQDPSASTAPGGSEADGSEARERIVPVPEPPCGPSVTGSLGGGLLISEGNARVANVIVRDNLANNGAGIAVVNGATPGLDNVLVTANEALTEGGGLFSNDAIPQFVNVRFVANQSAGSGGAAYVTIGSATFTNAVFSGNASTGSGDGGALVADDATVLFTGLTASGNRAVGSGGALAVINGGSATLHNVIVYGNQAAASNPGVFVDGTSSVTLNRGIVDDGIAGADTRDPRFTSPIDAATAPTTDGTLTVLEGSPALDRGDASLLPADSLDVDGDDDTAEPVPLHVGLSDRIIDNDTDGTPELDLGAYEAPSSVQPVEWAGLSASVDGPRVVLQWETLSETNNAGFEVQRRVDGTFTPVGFVDGAGTTSQPQRYRFRTDPLPMGTHTFRLRQLDADGTASLSDAVTARVRFDGTVQLTAPAPNPFATTTSVELTLNRTQHVTAAVYDALGRRVTTVHDGPLAGNTAHTLTVDAPSWTSGVYLLRVAGDSFSVTRRLVLVR